MAGVNQISVKTLDGNQVSGLMLSILLHTGIIYLSIIGVIAIDNKEQINTTLIKATTMSVEEYEAILAEIKNQDILQKYNPKVSNSETGQTKQINKTIALDNNKHNELHIVDKKHLKDVNETKPSSSIIIPMVVRNVVENSKTDSNITKDNIIKQIVDKTEDVKDDIIKQIVDETEDIKDNEQKYEEAEQLEELLNEEATELREQQDDNVDIVMAEQKYEEETDATNATDNKDIQQDQAKDDVGSIEGTRISDNMTENINEDERKDKKDLANSLSSLFADYSVKNNINSVSSIEYKILRQIVKCWQNYQQYGDNKFRGTVSVVAEFDKTGNLVTALEVEETITTGRAETRVRKMIAKDAIKALSQCTPLKNMQQIEYKEWRTVQFKFHY
ncbi:MAG: hypothetical protein JJW01_01315 [Alphaproteobacteria bacterium]|nr:hypothetical protein [Rickettsiales bacterium]